MLPTRRQRQAKSGGEGANISSKSFRNPVALCLFSLVTWPGLPEHSQAEEPTFQGRILSEWRRNVEVRSEIERLARVLVASPAGFEPAFRP